MASFSERIIYEYAANPLCLTAKHPALGRQSVSCKYTHENSTETIYFYIYSIVTLFAVLVLEAAAGVV